MTAFTRFITETFHVVSCYTCGVSFGIVEEMYNRAVKNKEGSVYCPACGNQTCWRGETEAQRLQKELDCEKARRADDKRYLESRIESANNHLRAEKAAKTRIKNRVANGVCPCCNRTFVNLQNHMKSQHPAFTKGD
jgi:predicted RNA-binding Zn-ribbon protein involved in translation (DUF1610 family)